MEDNNTILNHYLLHMITYICYWGFSEVCVGYTRSLFTTQTTICEIKAELLATGSNANN